MAMGRPRAFCVDMALNRALEVFWRKGYEGASLNDLTEAMGINKPSLYAAFGNKEELFRKALDRYIKEKVAYLREAVEAPTAYGMAQRMLFGAADMLTNSDHPVGCLTVKGALTCSDQSPSVKQEIDKIRINFETTMRDRLERAKQEGDLPADADTAHLCRFLSTIVQGMSVQAASGASRDDLMMVAGTALTAWPTKA